MRRRRFMAPAVVAMLFVNTIIQNAPAEQTVETEAQEKEVKVNSQTTQAAQSLEEAKVNLDQAKENTRQAQSAMEKADQEVKDAQKVKADAEAAQTEAVQKEAAAKEAVEQGFSENKMQFESELQAANDEESAAQTKRKLPMQHLKMHSRKKRRPRQVFLRPRKNMMKQLLKMVS